MAVVCRLSGRIEEEKMEWWRKVPNPPICPSLTTIPNPKKRKLFAKPRGMNDYPSRSPQRPAGVQPSGAQCASGMEYLGAVCILWVHPSIHLKAHPGAGEVLIPGVPWGLRRLRSLHPPGARSQEPGARSTEHGARSQDPAEEVACVRLESGSGWAARRCHSLGVLACIPAYRYGKPPPVYGEGDDVMIKQRQHGDLVGMK
ncbi:hypothetical protein I7I51_02844 [Histoplasma capsulatum]|uniref:Uncharacterized protein n=1 Tax=Ajellomyces capsulatus TaxID=5037 RepID=A0A8A1MPI7_AJECA|nr:hypothetical protein I7I51_02844 [Histoplasma capsulatum]